MNFVDERVTRLGFWVTLLGSLFALAPATYPGYWLGLEGFVPVFNAVHRGAIASLATTPDLWRGSGRGTFLLVQPLLLLGASPTLAVRVVFIVAILLGGLGCYVWLQPRLGDRVAGLSALVYVMLPPFLATVYIRGSLADALIIGLLPLTLAGTTSYVDTRAPSAAAVVVLSLLWMWRIQAGLAVFATLLLLAYAGVVERSRLTVLVVAVTGAAGLASLIPLWHMTADAPVAFEEHFLYAAQLFYGGWEVAPSVPGWQDGYPFQLGFAALGFTVAALWSWRLRARDIAVAPLFSRLLSFCLAGTLVLLLLSLNISRPLWQLTHAGRLLTYPWQLVLLACPLLAVLAGSLPALNTSLGRTRLWLLLAAVVLLSSYPYLTTNFTQIEPPQQPAAVIGDGPALAILDAQVIENQALENREAAADGEAANAPPTARLDIVWQVLQPLEFDYNVFFQAVVTDEEGDTVMAQLDTQPRQGEQPATTWQPGMVLTDTYQLQWDEPPGDEPPGDNLRYYFGYYDWRDNSRLPVDGGIDDKLILYGE